MNCNKCYKELIPLRRVLFVNGGIHLLAKCTARGAIFLPRTVENLELFEKFPLKDSRPRKRDGAYARRAKSIFDL